MSSRLANNMKQMAEAVVAGRATCTYGLVTSYNPELYAVKCTLQPPPPDRDDLESGWLPIVSAWVGPSWGLQMAPSLGDQAIIIFPEGDVDVGLVVGFLFNDEDKPQSVPSGEAWLTHKAGAFVKLKNNGEIQSKGTWKHEGTFDATVDVTAGGSHISLKGHKHTEQGDGNDVSAPHN